MLTRARNGQNADQKVQSYKILTLTYKYIMLHPIIFNKTKTSKENQSIRYIMSPDRLVLKFTRNLHELFHGFRDCTDMHHSLKRFRSEQSQRMAYITRGERGGRVLIHDGYKYQKNRTRGEAIHWRCWREACRAPLQTNLFDVEANAPNILIRHVSFTCESQY